MIKVIPNKDNFLTQIDWLTSFHHFSFGEHYDPTKVNFGPLRVFNDDTINPGQGFGFHQHHDMEIVTYVTEGTLEHEDDFGNKGVVSQGEVQRMSAGSGVFHSEYNHSGKILKLLQIWIMPDKKGIKPEYEQKKFSVEQRQDKLLCVISPKQDTMSIHQDVSFYISRLENKKTIHSFGQNRIGYLFVIDGKIKLNNVVLTSKDSAKIQQEKEIEIIPESKSEIILLDMPENFTKLN
jgi:redox-sensitive bicupin YhaK (pirin superfamily)